MSKLPEPDSTWDWATKYAELGWRSIPIKPGTKVPTLRGWQNHATTDPETLRKWFDGIYSNAGIGIVTGQESGTWVLDIDPAHGGRESLKQLVSLHGALPKGPKVDTPSGGFHLYFANPEGMHVATTKNIGQLNGHSSGLDVRGDGGQVLAPPTTHPNGGLYAWSAGRSPWNLITPGAPAWLLGLVVPSSAPPEPPASLPLAPAAPPLEHASAAEEIDQAYTWHELLDRDGWTESGRNGQDTMWTRPGKDKRLGVSAVLHEPQGPLVNFSTEATGLCQDWARSGNGDGWAYSIFGYLAATKFNGDRSLLARDWVQQRTANQEADWAATVSTHQQIVHSNTPAEQDPLEFANLVNWASFWAKERQPEHWLVWPLIPFGRSIALFAPAKEGKSTVVLAAVAAAACGRKVFGEWDTEPTDILYLDYEMTEDDLWERLSDLGFGADVDMSHLHYSMLPSIFPLDSKEGADQIVRLAEAVHAQAVIIDTYSRAVKGEENDADTSRNFYRWTGMALKARGIACLRTDHAGKVVAQGQRGSSAKNDDVDVVWSLEKTDSGIKITRTHTRINWVPESIAIEQHDDDGRIEYVITRRRTWSPGVKELAQAIEVLGLPIDAGYRTVSSKLREAGEGTRAERVREAMLYRKSYALEAWNATADPEGLI